MGQGTQLRGWVARRMARALVSRPATPVIVVGTLALAGVGAAAMAPTQSSVVSHTVVGTPALDLSSPHTFCIADPDGDGHTICHILASQVATVPNLGCIGDQDGDGTYICWYATDPRLSH